MPADIIFFAVLAVVILLWLRNVIGTRSGDERQRPNPYDPANHKKKEDQTPKEKLQDQDAPKPRPKMSVVPATNSYIDNKTAERALENIKKADKNFDASLFVSNARTAFEIIVTAFAKGDKDTLKNLLADPVYDAFAETIDARDERGERVETTIHEVEKAMITAAKMSGTTALITVEFTALETYVIRDKGGNVIAGKPGKKTSFTDIWVFSRDVKSKDPRWLLTETHDGEEELEGKTPLPDAK